MHQITTAFFLLIKKLDKQIDIINTVLIIGQMTSSEILGLYIIIFKSEIIRKTCYMRIIFSCAVEKCILLLICFMYFLTNEWIVKENTKNRIMLFGIRDIV